MTQPISKSSLPNDDKLTVPMRESDNPEEVTAKMLTGPFVTNAFTLMKFGKGSVGDMKIDNVVKALATSAKAIKANDFAQVEELLTSQALVLNTMFGELSRRSAANMGEYIEASQRYFNMAMKAQNQCRMTLETLSAIKNPPVVYARQANIAHGPQQVNNATSAASHAGENRNQPNKLLEVSDERPMDTGTVTAADKSHSAL